MTWSYHFVSFAIDHKQKQPHNIKCNIVFWGQKYKTNDNSISSTLNNRTVLITHHESRSYTAHDELCIRQWLLLTQTNTMFECHIKCRSRITRFTIVTQEQNSQKTCTVTVSFSNNSWQSAVGLCKLNHLINLAIQLLRWPLKSIVKNWKNHCWPTFTKINSHISLAWPAIELIN